MVRSFKIGNLEINSFLNSKGDPTDTPNFIQYFKSSLPKTPEARAEFLKDLGSFQNFVKRKKFHLLKITVKQLVQLLMEKNLVLCLISVFLALTLEKQLQPEKEAVF